MIVETLVEDSGLYVCHVTSQVLDKSVLSGPLELEVLGESCRPYILPPVTPSTLFHWSEKLVNLDI